MGGGGSTEVATAVTSGWKRVGRQLPAGRTRLAGRGGGGHGQKRSALLNTSTSAAGAASRKWGAYEGVVAPHAHRVRTVATISGQTPVHHP